MQSSIPQPTSMVKLGSTRHLPALIALYSFALPATQEYNAYAFAKSSCLWRSHTVCTSPTFCLGSHPVCADPALCFGSHLERADPVSFAWNSA
eukprot:774731-Pelagomonas_calceolata.AAC.3